MSRLHWDDTGKRTFELGIKNCVLFVKEGSTYHSGVAWSGVTSITERHEGGEENAFWSDGVKYSSQISTEEFKATIEAYQCPVEFYACDGTALVKNGLYATQQKRSRFGLCYTTTIGNDTKGVSHGEKIHLVYEAIAAPSERAYNTINNSPDVMTLSWEITTLPNPFIDNYLPCAHFMIDTTEMSPNLKKNLEDVLYGTATTYSRLPAINELEEIFTYPVLIDAEGNIVVNDKGQAVLMY